MLKVFLLIQETFGSLRIGRFGTDFSPFDKAPFLIKGVVNPQAIPTSRKPTTHLQVGGDAPGCVEVIEAIFSS